MDMIRVTSSAISAIGYDPASMRMKIQFVQGHTYDFCGVPSHVFQGLRDAGHKAVTTTITSVTAISADCFALGRAVATHSSRTRLACFFNSGVRTHGKHRNYLASK